MRIGLDIDNVISNFNEVWLSEYLNPDKSLRNSGIVNKQVYIWNMFDWSEEYKNNIKKIILKN